MHVKGMEEKREYENFKGGKVFRDVKGRGGTVRKRIV